jgi:hypothetical protein
MYPPVVNRSWLTIAQNVNMDIRVVNTGGDIPGMDKNAIQVSALLAQYAISWPDQERKDEVLDLFKCNTTKDFLRGFIQIIEKMAPVTLHLSETTKHISVFDIQVAPNHFIPICETKFKSNLRAHQLNCYREMSPAQKRSYRIKMATDAHAWLSIYIRQGNYADRKKDLSALLSAGHLIPFVGNLTNITSKANPEEGAKAADLALLLIDANKQHVEFFIQFRRHLQECFADVPEN